MQRALVGLIIMVAGAEALSLSPSRVWKTGDGDGVPDLTMGPKAGTERKMHQAHQKLSVRDVRDDALERLKSDDAFMANWPSRPGPPKTASDSCADWDSNGEFICGIEFPEHTLVRDWIPEGATVMEFGARYGTTSCEIAKKIGNDGRVVSVEPDKGVWPYLDTNLKSHNCGVHAVRGVLGSKPVTMGTASTEYAARTEEVTDESAANVVPNFHFDEIEDALGVKFDTLLIDCEGCGQFMMDQIGPKIKNQIDLVLFEADMGMGSPDCVDHCMDYSKFIQFLTDSGFEMVDKFNDCDRQRHGAPEGTWCGDYIDHYAFRRMRPI